MSAPNDGEPSIISSKRNEAEAEASSSSNPQAPTAPEAPPAYEPIGSPSTQVDHEPAATTTADAAPDSPQHERSQPHHDGPSISDPFNFPIDVPVPPYSPPEDKKRRYIVVPQVLSDPTAAFLPVFSPRLIAYGITEETWLAFLDTLSAFLTAKVSDRAVAHAGDVAKEVGQGPVNSFKEVVNHTKHVGKHVGKTAKHGDVVGAVFGVVGGAISIPVTAAMGLVSATLSLPGRTLAAATKMPQSQRARADSYITVANRDWFAARGLRAFLMDSGELSRHLGESVPALFAQPQAQKAVSAHDQLKVLAGKVADLEVWASAPKIEVKDKNLWVVLVEKEGPSY